MRKVCHQQTNRQQKLENDSLSGRQLLKVSSAARRRTKNRPAQLNLWYSASVGKGQTVSFQLKNLERKKGEALERTVREREAKENCKTVTKTKGENRKITGGKN